MTIEKKTVGQTVELYLDGWLDTQSAPLLGAALEELGPDVESLVIDLTALEYTSSAGIRQIVAAYKQMKGALVIRHASMEILDVLRMVGLDKKLHIEP